LERSALAVLQQTLIFNRMAQSLTVGAIEKGARGQPTRVSQAAIRGVTEKSGYPDWVVEIADLVDLTDADYIELGMSAGEGAKAANRSASTW
jgi:hypothetical protein